MKFLALVLGAAVLVGCGGGGNTELEKAQARGGKPVDRSAPTVVISSVGPVAADGTVVLSGTVTDNKAIKAVGWVITSVSGTTTLVGSNTSATWTSVPIPVQVGMNTISVIATDITGNTASVSTTVERMHHGMAPAIDVSKIPLGNPGYSTVRINPTTELPGPSDGTGAFRTVCDYTHMAFDDPIVLPNQPGAAHLHAFFGNTAVNAFSTQESIMTTGNSSCRGGIANRSAYWVPALIDTKDGTPLRPLSSNFYYKTGYNGIAPSAIQPIPVGLRMVAGNAKNTVHIPWNNTYRWGCIDSPLGGMPGTSIPNCPVGSKLVQEIWFPQCWDGVNLDSPDHKSHMSYTVSGACPATHPVPIPVITFNIGYAVTETDAPLRWRLSSDNYDPTTPAGYSSHGDYYFGWDKLVMEAWIKGCNQPAVDCRSHLLGDGRAIY